jgi:hypothetical protein
MMRILTDALVKNAITMVAPAVERILNQEDTVWGPRYVSVVVDGPGIDGVSDRLGTFEEWKKKWGPVKDFGKIARSKISISQRTGMPSDLVVHRHPWLLRRGDFIYQGGVAGEPGGLAVAVSGANSQTDECIAWLIYHAIEMKCRLRVREMESDKIYQV